MSKSDNHKLELELNKKEKIIEDIAIATILFDVRSKTVKRAKDLKESAEMHRTIYRAIRNKDIEAARNAMRDHLLTAQAAQAAEIENGNMNK